ncbi:hypothetical protein BsWGS_17268 [Bradybaena similaris]
MALRARTSKFRHVYGAQSRREQTFENVRITRNTHDSNFCSVNPKFLAVVTESSGGGCFVVLDVRRPGRVDVNCPRICGHEGAIMDIKWNPFDDCIIASGSDDATVKIWTVPATGLLGTLTDWSADLHGHSRRIGYVEWHPTAANVLMSVGFDYKIMIWNVEQAEPITSVDCHQDTIFSVSWGQDGRLIASTCKDKQIRIVDPRTAAVAMSTEGHQSAKAAKITFVTEHQVFTTGFARNSDRQYALWDIRKAGAPLMIEELDSSSGILLQYYDPDTRVMYVAGKGDGNIRYFEIDVGTVQFLNTYQTSLPQRGLGMMPKRGVDPFKNEVARFYKLHASKNLVEPVSMIVPRKAEGFQPDVFPPTASVIPSLTADEWTSGVNRGPILVDLQSGAVLDKPRSSMSPAVIAQNTAFSRPPQITTCKAVNSRISPPSSFNPTASSFSAAPYSKQTSPPSLRTSPEGYAQVAMGSPSQMPRAAGAQMMFGAVNGRDRFQQQQQQELASIRNIRDTSPVTNQGLSLASSVSSEQLLSTRSPASPSSFSSLLSSSPSAAHQVNGFAGSSTDESHPALLSSHVTPASSAASTTQPSQLPRAALFPHQRSDTGVQPRFNPIPGSSSAEHISSANMVIGAASAASHANAIHVRKVWSPVSLPAAPPHDPLLPSPSTDLELKKAYFRQLEEIRSLQEQLQLKDRRIKQLELELAHFKDIEANAKPEESNC